MENANQERKNSLIFLKIKNIQYWLGCEDMSSFIDCWYQWEAFLKNTFVPSFTI